MEKERGVENWNLYINDSENFFFVYIETCVCLYAFSPILRVYPSFLSFIISLSIKKKKTYIHIFIEEYVYFLFVRNYSGSNERIRDGKKNVEKKQ